MNVHITRIASAFAIHRKSIEDGLLRGAALLLAVGTLGFGAWAGMAIGSAAPLDQDCAETVVYCPRLDAPEDTTVTDPFDQRNGSEQSSSPSEDGVMTQSEFPCQEDEVLGYAPQFGPDKVGCIHIDQFR